MGFPNTKRTRESVRLASNSHHTAPHWHNAKIRKRSEQKILPFRCRAIQAAAALMKSAFKVPRRDRRRVDEFVRCYNEIDAELRRLLRKTKKISFVDLVAEFERSGCTRKDTDLLRRVAGLRNFIIHEPRERTTIFVLFLPN